MAAPVNLQSFHNLSPCDSNFPKSQLFLTPQSLPNFAKSSSRFLCFSTRRSYFRDDGIFKISCRAASTSTAQEEFHDEKRREEAREAIRDYLEHFGALSDDASRISSSCPNYLNSLIDAVDDLDYWNSWAAADSTQEILSENATGFMKKIYQMAERKGDNGVLPFLESLGVSLSSATHLAHYLSANNTLPGLIRKVNCMKEILFSGSDDDGIIGKNALRMMAHLSISVDEDVQQTLAFFEKIQARRGGLNLLGSEDASLPCVIESFPRILYLPLESCIPATVKFLEDIAVPKGCMRNIFLLFPPILTYDIEKDIKPRLQLYEKVGAKDHYLGKMLVKYPWILSYAVSGNFVELLDFFDKEKVSKLHSSRTITKWPLILGCSINKLKLTVRQFHEMGMDNKKLGQIISTSPQLLLHRPQEIVQVTSFLKDLGMDEEAISKTLGRCPEIFASSIDKTLKRKLEFLSGIGISRMHLPRIIRKYPELFICDVERALLPRVRYLQKVGLSKKDIRSMVSRFSPLLGYSIKEVLQPKLEFLINTMGFPLSKVVDYPRYFSYSLEKKIKPRYLVLKGGNIEFNLEDMLGKNDEEFASEYLGVGEMLAPPPPT